MTRGTDMANSLGLKETNWRRALGKRGAGEDLNLNYLFSHLIFSILIQLFRKTETFRLGQQHKIIEKKSGGRGSPCIFFPAFCEY